MKNIAIVLIAVAAVGCNNASNNDNAGKPRVDTPVAAAAKTETPPPAPPMDSAAMMKKWQEFMTPGGMHKMMASWAGKWNTESTMWEDEKKPPTTAKGTCENTMVLGGRYQESVHHGEFMGTPFEGRGTLGYDNTKKMFVSSWIDNFGTGIMNLEGPYDSATKTITLKGNWDDPIKGKMEMRQTLKIVDDKNQVMEMYSTQNGKESKWMEMKMTRKG